MSDINQDEYLRGDCYRPLWIKEEAARIINSGGDLAGAALEDSDLGKFLDDIEGLTNRMGGSVRSRQVLALALTVYKRLEYLERMLHIVDWNNILEKEEQLRSGHENERM